MYGKESCQHIKDFVWINDHDGEEIEIAFSQKIEMRKEWLRTHQVWSLSAFVNLVINSYSIECD